MPHRLTWLAIGITFVLLVPGEAIGYVAGLIYRWSTGMFFGGDSLLDLLSHGWASIVIVQAGASLVAGICAGYLSVLVCGKITKRADLKIVAYANSALVVVFAALAILGDVVKHDVGLGTAAIVVNTVGVCVGLFWAVEQIDQERNKVSVTPAVVNPTQQS